MQTPVDEQMVPPRRTASTAPDQDDTLILLFMCCHPALTRSSAVALTLRAVGGLTTAEIASAYLVPEATMAQRISRAKQRIKSSGVPFRMPTIASAAISSDAVLHVLYLIFNEGYASSSGPQLQRTDLSNEAIRLARAVHQPASGGRRGRRPACADAPDRRATDGAHRAGRRADPARPNRIGRCGIDRAISEGHRAGHVRALEGLGRLVSAPGGDRRVAR